MNIPFRRLLALSCTLSLTVLLAQAQEKDKEAEKKDKEPAKSAEKKDKEPTKPAENEVARPLSESTLYPLKVGNTWYYKAGDNYFMIKVAELKEVEGKPRARLDLIINNKVISNETVGLTKDGLVRYTFEGKEAKPPIEFLRLPPKSGTSWKLESKVEGASLKGTFKAGEEEVRVPAGSFKAVTVTGTDIDANNVKMNLTYFFAEKVGMVKQIIELGGQKIVVELEKFELAK